MMRNRRGLGILAVAAMLALWATTAQAEVTFDWATVGNGGNPPDTEVMLTDSTTGYGSVADTYRISKHEVTNTQYAEFLNAIDPGGTNPNAVYNANMGSGLGGIGFNSGNPNGSKYAALAGREAMPVNFVSFWDATRFANWLHNGQGSGDTENGAYTLTSSAISDNTVTREPAALWFIPSEDEWYKAAYYDPTLNSGLGGYFDFPTGSDTAPTAEPPPGGSNSANYGFAVGDLTDAGAYMSSDSFYGTFDQGGNVREWNETMVLSARGVRGGSFNVSVSELHASGRLSGAPAGESNVIGFRVASPVPEPGSLAMCVSALALGLVWLRRKAKT